MRKCTALFGFLIAILQVPFFSACNEVTIPNLDTPSPAPAPSATPGTDSSAPIIVTFSLPLTASSLSVNVNIAATDDVGVTGYILSEIAATPSINDMGWTPSVPTTYVFASAGAKTLYAWAKDAAGNISNSLSASLVITLPDTTAPTVTAFTMPATATSLTVSVSNFTATDNVAVTGYLITESSTAPASGAAGWSGTVPTTFAFSTSGARTAYAWAKDAAGNVSSSLSAHLTITLPPDPLLSSSNLTYLGAFRVPLATNGVLTSDRGGTALTFSPAGNGGVGSLFIGGKSDVASVLEISIPTAVNSATVTNLPTAMQLQSPHDPTEGNSSNLGSGGSALVGTAGQLGGLLVYNDALVGTSYSFYDGSGGGAATQLSHFTHSLGLASAGTFNGMYHVGSYPSNGNASFVSGYMSLVPDNSSTGGTNWRTSLGGPALTGQGGLSIVSRTSFGPAAFSFDPSALTGPIGTSVPAIPLLYYPSMHPTLGVNAATSAIFNGTTKIAGMVMVPGTRSILYFGYQGLGDYTYGAFTSDTRYADECDPAIDTCICDTSHVGLAGAKPGCSGIWYCADPNNCTSGRARLTDCSQPSADGCYYDPTGMGSKGPHAYPYVYQVWAYDANDLIHVKNGDIIGSERSVNIDPSCSSGTIYQPWCIRPYAVWQLPFAMATTSVFGGAAAYNPVTQTVYIAEPGADTIAGGGYARLPLIHVFHVDLTTPSATSFKVGGQVILLNGTVVLKNNGGDALSLSASDRNTTQAFSFAANVPAGNPYSVTVSSQPTGQNCTILHGTGTSTSDVSNILVICHNQ